MVWDIDPKRIPTPEQLEQEKHLNLEVQVQLLREAVCKYLRSKHKKDYFEIPNELLAASSRIHEELEAAGWKVFYGGTLRGGVKCWHLAPHQGKVGTSNK